MEASGQVKQSETLRVARLHINRLQMENSAYGSVYGERVYHPLRLALVTVVREIARADGPIFPDTEDHFMVDKSIVVAEIANARYGGRAKSSDDAANKYINEAVDRGMFSVLPKKEIAQRWPKTEFPNLPFNRKKTYLYLTEQQFQKLSALTGILTVIDDVIAEQESEPKMVAPSHAKLPPGVYFDVFTHHD